MSPGVLSILDLFLDSPFSCLLHKHLTTRRHVGERHLSWGKLVTTKPCSTIKGPVSTATSLERNTISISFLNHIILFFLVNPSLTMDAFEYIAKPSHIVFGNGTQQKLPAELERLSLSAPLILSTPQQVDQAEKLMDILGGKAVGIFQEATMHTPTKITEKVIDFANSRAADCVISIGGGSTIGLGKAISIRTGLVHICIPTTYAGSEVTPILGETMDGLKQTRTDPKILPTTVIYNISLTMTLPASMSAYSGINSIAHAGKSGFPVFFLS